MLDLNTVMINSEQPDVLAEFYTKLFGKPGYADNGYTGWQLGSSYLMVGPHSEVKGTNTAPGRIMWGITTNDVEGECKRMAEQGAKVIAEPYHPGPAEDMWLATLADPDNNYLQLATPMDMPEE